MTIRKLAVISVLFLQYLLGFASLSNAQEENSEGNLNWRMPTLGGKQFWADELFFHRWRIQQNVFTGHYRLLDENDIRYAWGTFDECKAALEKIKIERNLPPMKGKAVIVLHGICGTRLHTTKISQYLETKGGYEVFNVAYPTTQKEISEHAKTLAKVIDNLDGIEELNFVGHSMGNLVIRCYLNDLKLAEAARPANASAKKRPKFNRFVMLAPPNHGSGMAKYFGDNLLYQAVTGDSGKQLGLDWNAIESHLATPDFEFGIIAGGKGDGKGYNPMIVGDNDGILGVETTKLDGAKDFIVIPAVHPLMQNTPEALSYTLHFLKEGKFR